MRTLKKVLALSLVFAMAFTLMAGAAFKDQDKIDSELTDDIQLLAALGVFQGDENGNFNPEANVTRAQAAKMIYVLKNNGIDDGAVAFQGVSTYADVPTGFWGEGYINYCTNLGVMNGWKEGNVQKFDPNGNVTGVELTKMLLCMIGYKADIQGYTGNGWQTNVLQDAAEAGVTVNYIPSIYAAAPRQWTSRLLVNAINAPYVTYSKGELTFGTVANPNMSYAQKYLKLYVAEGTLMANNAVTTGNSLEDTLRGTKKTNSLVVVEKINGVKVESVKEEGTSFEVNADASLLGQSVKVYYRDDSTAGSNKVKVYAVMNNTAQRVVNTTLDQISFDSTTKTKMTVKDQGTKNYTGDSHKITLYVDNVKLCEQNPNTERVGTNPILEDYLGANSKANVKLIYDDNDYVVAAYVTNYPVLYGIVDSIDSANGVFKMVKNDLSSEVKLKQASGSNITFNRANKDNFSKYLNIEGSVEEGDVVKATVNATTGELKYDITVIDSLSGSAQGYTVKDNGTAYKTIKVGGTDYKLSSKVVEGYDWATANSAGTHKTFYADGGYVVYSTGDSVAATVSNLAYVIAGDTSNAGFGTTNLKVKVLLADGTVKPYTMNKKSGIGKTITEKAEGSWKEEMEKLKGNVYTYSLSDDTITLKPITTKASLDGNRATYMQGASSIEYAKKTGVATVKIGETDTAFKTNDASYFFVANPADDDYKVFKASELKGDIAAGDSAATTPLIVAQNVGGFKTMLVGVLQLSTMPAAEAKDYYFVTGAASYIGEVDNKYVVELPVNAAGTETKLTFKFDDEASISGNMADLNKYVGKLINVDLKSDDSVDVAKGTNNGMTIVTTPGTDGKWGKGVLNAWDGKTASIGTDFITVADNVKIYNVNVKFVNNAADSAKLVDDNSVVKAEGGATNALYLKNSDGKITAIFTEIDGEDISFVTTAPAGE